MSSRGSSNCFIVSIGYNPFKTISAFDYDIFGKTNPGQSQRVTTSVSLRVWKCLVFPGILATPTFFLPSTALITLDLPTLGYPVNPISTPVNPSAYFWNMVISWCGDSTKGELRPAYSSLYPNMFYFAVKNTWSIFWSIK